MHRLMSTMLLVHQLVVVPKTKNPSTQPFTLKPPPSLLLAHSRQLIFAFRHEILGWIVHVASEPSRDLHLIVV